MSNRVSIPTYSAILTDPRYASMARLMRALNSKWIPHPGQAEVGAAIFVQGKRRIGVECGRKWGKSEIGVDLCWRLGNMIQNGQGYYFGAQQTAVREIIWANDRMQGWGPAEYVRDIHRNEMRMTFASGTFVKCDGADEFRGRKGFNPDFVICDEAADYSDAFWHAMRPNFASKDCIVVIITTPPWELESEPGRPCYFLRMMDIWKKNMEDAARKGEYSPYFYTCQPTHANEKNLPTGFLQQEEKELRELGCEDIWEREYLARRVIAGGKRIIGTFKPDKHVYPFEWIWKYKIERNIDILNWLTIVDPSQTLFGMLIIAINPYTKEVFFLDEIAERDENETTEHALWPRIKEIEDACYPPTRSEDPDRFVRVCDEAAKWWIVGCANDPEIGVAFNPTEKASNSIEMGVSILRSVFRYGLGYVSDKCVTLSYQLVNWRRKQNGAIPETGKDLVDCARYGIHEAGYYLSREEAPQLLARHPRAERADIIRDTPEAYAETLAYKDFLKDDGLSAFDNLGEEDAWPFH